MAATFCIFLFASTMRVACLPVLNSPAGDISGTLASVRFKLDWGIMNKKNQQGKASVCFSDSFMEEKSSVFRSELAVLCSALSAAAYSSREETKDAEYLSDALTSLVFEDSAFYNYDGYESDLISDTVGYSFSHRVLKFDDKKCNLILIVFRGTTGDEWYSNFNIGIDSDLHVGFSAASSPVLGRLRHYLALHGLSDKDNKFLLTGHSRGGAAANLLSAQMAESEEFAIKEDIFAYTFACPNVSKRALEYGRNAEYDGIFNIVNPEDFVPYIPLTMPQWGYGKFGKCLLLPTARLSEKFELLHMDSVNKTLASISGKKYSDKGFDCIRVSNFLLNFSTLAKSAQDFYNLKLNDKTYGDITPAEYFTSVCDHLTGKEDKSDFFKAMLLNNHYKDVTSFLIGNEADKFISKRGLYLNYSHAPESYLAWMIACGDSLLSVGTKPYSITISCDKNGPFPVDIEIVDKNGVSECSIKNGSASGKLKQNGTIFSPNSSKRIFLWEGSYSASLKGIRTGNIAITFESHDIFLTGDHSVHRFDNVSVSKEETLLYMSESGSLPRLYLLKKGEETAEIATNGEIISTPSPKKTVAYAYVVLFLGIIAVFLAAWRKGKK